MLKSSILDSISNLDLSYDIGRVKLLLRLELSNEC